MTPDQEKHIYTVLSRFKSGQINAGQVVREIEEVYGEIEQDLNYSIDEYHKAIDHYESLMAEAKRRIAELEAEIELSSLNQTDQHPDTEADGFVFCGKCGGVKTI